MGKTSVNTACRPVFLRREGDTSNCKNSRYELVCNSIKFGGGMISLILPKLILSVARDGIFIPNQVAGDWPAGSFFRKRRKASSPRVGKLAIPNPNFARKCKM